MLVGWTFTRTLTPVLMKLSGSPRLRLYNEKYGVVRPLYSSTHRLKSKLTLTSRPTASTMSCVVCKLNFSGAKVKGHESCLWSEGSKDAKVPWNESSWNIRYWGAKVPWNESSWNICSWGAKVPQERKFHGTKVLGLFAPRERMFHGTKVPREQKFSLWSFRSRERKCRGTKRPVTSDRG